MPISSFGVFYSSSDKYNSTHPKSYLFRFGLKFGQKTTHQNSLPSADYWALFHAFISSVPHRLCMFTDHADPQVLCNFTESRVPDGMQHCLQHHQTLLKISHTGNTHV